MRIRKGRMIRSYRYTVTPALVSINVVVVAPATIVVDGGVVAVLSGVAKQVVLVRCSLLLSSSSSSSLWERSRSRERVRELITR